LEVLCS